MPCEGLKLSENLRSLVEARASVWEKIKTHLDTAEAEGRADTVEADETYKRMHEDMSSLDKRLADAVELSKRNDAAEEIRARYAPKHEAPEAVDNDEATLRKMIAGEVRGFDFKPQTRDLVKGTTTAGGFTVKTSFYDRLVESMIVNAGMLRVNPTVLNTAAGETIQIPKATTHPTASWILEAGTITESDPVFAQTSLSAYKLGFSVDISSELEQDTSVDLLGYLARRGGEALGNGAGAAYVVGDGTNKPTGVTTQSTLGVTGAASVVGAFSADNLIDLFYSVIEPYRINGRWLMNDSSLAAVRKLKDSSGRYLFEVEGGMGNAPGVGTILGKPVVTDPNVAAVALAAKSVLFGDFSSYFVRNVSGIRVERSEHFQFRNDLVTWRFLMRTDGKLIDTSGAVKHFIGNAA